MIDYIYYERDIEGHPRTQQFFLRFPKARKIPCNHYKEVFNPNGQSFRLQKKKPALILAKQNGKKIHSIPPSYGIGGRQNFYFSHLLNCLYDCRYCFLQGMFPSAHYVLFVNYEDFWEDILTQVKQTDHEPSWFFSGYDCDSLGMESVTQFAEFFLPLFAQHPKACLELRTKSLNIGVLKKMKPLENVITAFSFTPEEISKQLEHGVPSVHARTKAMHQLAKLGWQVGIRIDPVMDCLDFEERYRKLFDELLTGLPMDALHSVSLGAFRMPNAFFRRVEKIYPEEPLFAGKLVHDKQSVSYAKDIESARLGTCKSLLLDKVPPEKLFDCEINSPAK